MSDYFDSEFENGNSQHYYPASDVPFLNVSSAPKIDQTFYLGNRETLKSEIELIKKQIQTLPPFITEPHELLTELSRKIQRLIDFAKDETPTISERVLIGLLSIYSTLLRANNAPRYLIQLLTETLIVWGLPFSSRYFHHFFVFSIVDSVQKAAKRFPNLKEIVRENITVFYDLISVNQDEKSTRKVLDLLLSLELVSKQFYDEKLNFGVPNFKNRVIYRTLLDHDPDMLLEDKSKVTVVALGTILVYLVYLLENFSLLSVDQLSLVLALYHYFQALQPKSPALVFVTDTSGFLNFSFSQIPLVRQLQVDPIHRIKSFHDVYLNLLQRHKQVWILSPDSQVFVSYHYALEAAKDMLDHVKVLDTHTYGYGIGVLLQSLMDKKLGDGTAEDVLAYFESAKSRLKNWVVFKSDKLLLQRYWFKKMIQTQAQFLKKAECPIVGFHQKGGIAYVPNLDFGIDFLMERVNELLKDTYFHPSKVFIHHKGCLDQVIRLRHFLKQRFSIRQIFVVPASDVPNVYFGEHISLTIL